MPRPTDPEHRAKRIQDAPESNEIEAPLERAYAQYLVHNETEFQELEDAIELYADSSYRHIVNALLLCNAHPDHVEAMLQIRADALRCYAFLFFDVNVFRHALARNRYVSQLACDPAIKALYELGLTRGPMALLERFRIGARPQPNPTDVLYDILGDTWTKFASHRGQAVTSEVSERALRWGQTAVRTAMLLAEQTKGQQTKAKALKDITIALETREQDMTPEASGIDLDTVITK